MTGKFMKFETKIEAMKVGIIGSGGLGAMFGGFLKRNGEDVHLYDIWEEHVETINEQGLFIERIEKEDFRVYPPATTNPEDIGTVDVAFVFVKSQHTEESITAAEPMIGGDTVIVTVQNGLTNIDTIERIYPDNPIMAGPTYVGGTTIAPGHVKEKVLLDESETKIGSVNSEVELGVVELLSDAGIPSTVVENPTGHVWDKQLAIIGFVPISALTGLPMGLIAENEELTPIMEALVEEAVEVGKAKDVGIFSEDYVAKAYHLCERVPDTKPSTLVDVENERPTEIDHLNGAIVKYGEDVGIDTPYNRTLTALLKGKEQSYL